MSYRRWAAMAVVLGLLFSGPPVAHADTPYEWDFDKLTDSFRVQSGEKGVYDDFTGLTVRVSKTQNLGNEGIAVTWTGGASTPQSGFQTNYLQMMQCWGADPKALDFRETCQYGSGKALGPGTEAPGTDTHLRDLMRSNPDPLETMPDPGVPAPDPSVPEPKPVPQVPSDWQSVPFRSALTGDATPNGSPRQPYPKRNDLPTLDQETPEMLSRFFDRYSSNEVPYARTSTAHTGRVIFEVQTAVQAPHLGCGVRKDATGNLAPCWLVIVPRGDHDANGAEQKDGNSTDGSPLSRTFFQSAIAVPLEFAPVSSGCPVGAAERGMMGTELAVDAITSWQPKLCAVTGSVYGYSQNSDADVRSRIAVRGRGAPGMGFTIDPVRTGEGDPTVLQGPVTLSSVVVAFNIDNQKEPAGADEGTPVTELKLTPRIVAKLLTHSYQRDVPGGTTDPPPQVSTNIKQLRVDPEFVELNPQFAKFLTKAAPDGLMVSLPDNSAAREVWRWIRADKDANDWLNGTPYSYRLPNDPNTPRLMRVNSTFAQEFTDGKVPSNYPNPDPTKHKNDPSDAVKEEGYDMGKYRPYMKSMHEAALQTARADGKGKTEWDPSRNPPAYKANPPQTPGRRFSLSITDSVSAQRYGLYPASLRNANGEFVAPTPDAMLAGAAAMVPSAAGSQVLTIDPQKKAPGAYPLTMLTYAAADTSEEPAARKDFANMLRYAVADGQNPGRARGQLPPGYVPLPQNLRAQTLAMANQLEKWVNPPEPGEQVEESTPDRGVVPQVAVPAPSLGAKTPVPAARSTRSVPVGLLRWAWVAILTAGLVGALSGPTLLRWESRRRRRT
ncbi:hypothetical protein Lfu02_55890 [Longispora fulva]|uniref:PBP domain-containing protein n=1 Tax=Longispora fulva TaxID=619741 RepID=A0A8J7GSG9_9ACTN|nr:hypothetical protein [Longispora fulva]MBG6137428.1 hypothetical protein [Longispora fulva]GIG61217.1 hypothetical protein Lfu02_55890 [Longispora fulva]